MKLYVKSAVNLDEQMCAIIKYDNAPIGWLSNRTGHNSLYVQVDPSDLTKAHGIAISNQRGMTQRAKRAMSLHLTSLAVFDGKQCTDWVVGVSTPFTTGVSRGYYLTSWRSDVERMDLSSTHFSYEIVPISTEVRFVPLSSVATIYPALEDTIPDYKILDRVFYESGLWQPLFSKYDISEIESGIADILWDDPIFAESLWQDAHKFSSTAERYEQLPAKYKDPIEAAHSNPSNHIDNWIQLHQDQIHEFLEDLHAQYGDISGAWATLGMDVDAYLRKLGMPDSYNIFHPVYEYARDYCNQRGWSRGY